MFDSKCGHHSPDYLFHWDLSSLLCDYQDFCVTLMRYPMVHHEMFRASFNWTVDAIYDKAFRKCIQGGRVDMYWNSCTKITLDISSAIFSRLQTFFHSPFHPCLVWSHHAPLLTSYSPRPPPWERGYYSPMPRRNPPAMLRAWKAYNMSLICTFFFCSGSSPSCLSCVK